MPTAQQDATLAAKVRTLAGWSLGFRSGVEELVKEGLDADELDARIAGAEEQLKTERVTRQRRAQAMKKFN